MVVDIHYPPVGSGMDYTPGSVRTQNITALGRLLGGFQEIRKKREEERRGRHNVTLLQQILSGETEPMGTRVSEPAPEPGLLGRLTGAVTAPFSSGPPAEAPWGGPPTEIEQLLGVSAIKEAFQKRLIEHKTRLEPKAKPEATASRIARKIATSGWESLSEPEKQWYNKMGPGKTGEGDKTQDRIKEIDKKISSLRKEQRSISLRTPAYKMRKDTFQKFAGAQSRAGSTIEIKIIELEQEKERLLGQPAPGQPAPRTGGGGGASQLTPEIQGKISELQGAGVPVPDIKTYIWETYKVNIDKRLTEPTKAKY